MVFNFLKTLNAKTLHKDVAKYLLKVVPNNLKTHSSFKIVYFITHLASEKKGEKHGK